ncbi:MAG: hypothetical protein U9Q22_03570 [Candidatus Altiarchaeota archaeon]|nr:hypothetical protein [Candidatus Altiarchaeota archaeon]
MKSAGQGTVMYGRKAGERDSDKMFEIKRQLAHLTLGLSIAAAVFFLEPVYGKLIIIPLLMGVSVLIILPELGAELKVHNHLLFHFERPKDIEHFPYRGAILYGIGITPAILLLDVNTACAIIAVLSVGDSASTLIGRSCGKHRVGHKSIEGFIGFIVFSFFGAWLFLQNDPLAAVTYAVVGGFIELSNVGSDHILLDDNLIIPLGLTIFTLLIF